MKKLLPIILLAILLLTTVNAQQENFDAFGPVIIKTFQCSTYQFPITVSNTGDVASTYYLEVDGTARQWIQFAPSSFVLAPGETREILSFLTAPCDAYGEYTLDIYILTSYGLEKVIMQDITVEKPLNVDILAKTSSQSIAPCQTAEYTLTIVNPFTFTETYLFSLDTFQDEAKFSQEKLTLQANTSKDITISINSKNCEQTGEYNIIFSAEAEKTGTIAEVDLKLDIKDSGIPIIAEGVNSIKTHLAESAAPLTIFNKGEEAKEYTLSITGPSWITIDTTTLSVEAQNKEQFNLFIRPPEGIEKGDYTVKITATDQDEAEYSKEIMIKLRSTTFLGRLFSDYLWQTIIGIIIFIALVISIYFIVNKLTSEEAKLARVKRKKEREKKKEELKKQKEKIKAQKEKEKQKKQKELDKAKQKAIDKYDKQIKSEYELISKKDIVQGERIQTRWVFNLVLFFVTLIILAVLVQFRTFFWTHKYYVALGIIILIALFILRKITRIRKAIATWRGLILANEVLLMNINWRKGLHQLSFKMDAPAKKIKVIAKQGRTRHAKHTHPKEFVYKYFRVLSSIQDVDVKEAKYRFKISRKWLNKREIKTEDIALAVLKGDHYSKLKTTREGSDSKYVYYKATADCFGQFAIIGKTSAKERYKPYWIAWVVLLVLLVIGGAIALKLTTDQPIHVKGIPPQMWQQDTQHSLDLNAYFNDPDGDELTYNFNEVRDIDVWIDQGTAYFMPDIGWSGQRSVTFTATDGKGGEVQSNPVKLVVKKTLIPKQYAGYLKYVLAGIILLVIIITILILRKPIMKWLEEDF